MTTDERNNFDDANDVDRIMEIAQANDNPHELIHLAAGQCRRDLHLELRQG